MFDSRISALVPPRLPGSTGSALGFGAAVAATLVARVGGAAERPLLGLVLLAVVAAGVGSVTTVPGALAASAQCWGLYSGFVLHRLGEIRLDPPSRSALLLLLALGPAASLLTLALGAVLARPRRRALTEAAQAPLREVRSPVSCCAGPS
jgi:hypothetical protein